MNRTNFYNKLVVDGIEELDFLWNSLSEFEMQYRPEYYRVKSSDLLRPDIISYKCYGSVDYWWIILLVNNITNPFTDLVEGIILTIPSKLDIYNFQKKFRVRKST
jgi:hypothetical protein